MTLMISIYATLTLILVIIIIIITIIIIIIIIMIMIIVIIMFPMDWVIQRQPRIIQQASYPVGFSFSHPILSKLVLESI